MAKKKKKKTQKRGGNKKTQAAPSGALFPKQSVRSKRRHSYAPVPKSVNTEEVIDTEGHPTSRDFSEDVGLKQVMVPVYRDGKVRYVAKFTS